MNDHILKRIEIAEGRHELNTACATRTVERESHRPPAISPILNTPAHSELAQWPVKIPQVSPTAPYLQGAHLLIAADCAAFAYAGLHDEFMQGRVTMIGCPKYSGSEYQAHLLEIFRQSRIASITVVRMEVACCTGLSHAAFAALEDSGLDIPWRVVTLSTDGRILHEVA